MKKHTIFQNIFLGLVMLLGIVACQERETLVIENESPAILMDLSAESLFLDKNFPDNPALNITWETAKYSQPTEIRYKIEASATEDFQEAMTVSTVNGSARTVTYTVGEMNTVAQTLGLEAGEVGTLYFRVVSYIGDGGEYLSSTSNTSVLSITPYVLDYPTFFIVGNASVADWNAGDALMLYKHENLSVLYTHLVGGNSFRFLGQANWNPINYSIDQEGTRPEYRYFKQVSDNLAQDGEENMKFNGTTGMYKVTIDATTGVQSLTVEASPVAGYDFPEIYLVGSMNGWNAESPLTLAKVGDGIYEITTPLAADAEFKFLGQKSWGDAEWANIIKENAGNSGYLGPKGDNGNIQFAGNGGDYTIRVNVKAGTYTIE